MFKKLRPGACCKDLNEICACASAGKIKHWSLQGVSCCRCLLRAGSITLSHKTSKDIKPYNAGKTYQQRTFMTKSGFLHFGGLQPTNDWRFQPSALTPHSSSMNDFDTLVRWETRQVFRQGTSICFIHRQGTNYLVKHCFLY